MLMLRRRRVAFTSFLFSSLISATLCLAFPVQATAAVESNTLKVGRITANPAKDLIEFTVLADYLGKRLQHVGIDGGEVVFARSLEEMAQLIDAGQVDVLSDSLYPQLQLQAMSGLELLANEHRDGQSSYHAIMISRKDSGIEQLSQLAGKQIAFEDEGSTPSYFVPRMALEQTGFTLVEGIPSTDQVGYVFAREEINITKWVHSKKVAVGALSNKDWSNPERMPPFVKKDLQVIYRSAEFPRSVLGVRASLQPSVKQALRTLLLETPMSPADQAEIYPYRDVTGYSAIEASQLGAFTRQVARIIDTQRR